MVSRFKRRGGPPEVTFFVFQDILTSMIGILIIVTLALALQADESDDSPLGIVAEAKLSEKLEKTLAQLAEIKARVETWGSVSGTVPSQASIDAEEASLRAKIAIYGNSNAQRHAAAQKLPQKENGLGVISTELDQDKKRRKVLRLIPENSDTTKKPIIVEVSGTGYKMNSLEVDRKTSEGSYSDFRNALRPLKAAEQFLVFYFKPSATALFKDYLQAAKDAKFEMGYDLIGENVDLEF